MQPWPDAVDVEGPQSNGVHELRQIQIGEPETPEESVSAEVGYGAGDGDCTFRAHGAGI